MFKIKIEETFLPIIFKNLCNITSRFMTADALTILETPVIVKRSMRRTGTPEDSRRDAHTPQSILKVGVCNLHI